MGIGGSNPEDCQSSAEAQQMANRFKTLAESARNDDTGMIMAANQFTAADRYREAQRWQARADELRAQGK